MKDDDFTLPGGAPGQKARVLHWLQTEPGGLTALQAMQHLAVARLASIIHRLREDDGHNIVAETVEMPTRYGDAKVARYHLRPSVETHQAHRTPTQHQGGMDAPAEPLARLGERGPDPYQVTREAYDRVMEQHAKRVDTERMRRELFGD